VGSAGATTGSGTAGASGVDAAAPGGSLGIGAGRRRRLMADAEHDVEHGGERDHPTAPTTNTSLRLRDATSRRLERRGSSIGFHPV
jgi:hypothetical protein